MISLFKPLLFIPPKVLPWIILFFAAINMIFLGGKRRAFGTFVATLHKQYNISLTELNWIGDSYSALGYMSSSISIAIILHFNRRYALFQFIGSIFVLVSCIASAYVPNPHWMFLTHTLVHGIGSSLIISTVGLVVNEHFNRRHPYHLLATTLVSGGSVAAILFVTFFAYLIQKYNWRFAFIILGVLYFVILASPAIVFRKNDQLLEYNDNKKGNFKFDEIRRWQIPLLILWFIDRVMTSVVTYGLLLNLTDYVHRLQPNLVRSTILTTLFAGGEGSTYLIGAIITAATKDFFKNKLRFILLATSIVMSASLIALEFMTHNMIARRTLCFLAGFSMGPSITFLFPAGEELTQLPGHLAYPFSLGGMGFGMIISPLLTAKIAEIFAYKWFFLVQGGLIFIKVICLFLITLQLWYYRFYELLLENSESLAREDISEVTEESVDENSVLLNNSSKIHYK